jgi:hypothetical protein
MRASRAKSNQPLVWGISGGVLALGLLVFVLVYFLRGKSKDDATKKDGLEQTTTPSRTEDTKRPGDDRHDPLPDAELFTYLPNDLTFLSVVRFHGLRGTWAWEYVRGKVEDPTHPMASILGPTGLTPDDLGCVLQADGANRNGVIGTKKPVDLARFIDAAKAKEKKAGDRTYYEFEAKTLKQILYIAFPRLTLIVVSPHEATLTSILTRPDRRNPITGESADYLRKRAESHVLELRFLATDPAMRVMGGASTYKTDAIEVSEMEEYTDDQQAVRRVQKLASTRQQLERLVSAGDPMLDFRPAFSPEQRKAEIDSLLTMKVERNGKTVYLFSRLPAKPFEKEMDKLRYSK